MGFLFRAAVVIGTIYAISPMRDAGEPLVPRVAQEALARSAQDATRQALGAAATLCRDHTATCLKAAAMAAESRATTPQASTSQASTPQAKAPLAQGSGTASPARHGPLPPERPQSAR
jgi:hypothetical protein